MLVHARTYVLYSNLYWQVKNSSQIPSKVCPCMGCIWTRTSKTFNDLIRSMVQYVLPRAMLEDRARPPPPPCFSHVQTQTCYWACILMIHFIPGRCLQLKVLTFVDHFFFSKAFITLSIMENTQNVERQK